MAVYWGSYGNNEFGFYSHLDDDLTIVKEYTEEEADAIIAEANNTNCLIYPDEDNDYLPKLVSQDLTTKEELELEIEELKQYLQETDYVVIKIAEGVATTDEYADIITKRQETREKINELQAEIEALE